MPTSTTNYGLIKPGTDDPILIGQLNDNADVIDATMKSLSDALDVAKLGIKYKGEVNYYSNLPATGNEIGDAYTVKYAGSSGTTPDGTEYVWGTVSGTNQWINFSKDSYTKAEVDALLALKQDALTTAQLAAANSGIDSTKVEQIETNKINISKDEAALVELVDGGAKNKLKLSNPSVPTGLTCTANSDGSYTVSGTLSSANSITFSINAVDGDLILSGCPAGGGTSTYLCRITKSGVAVSESTDTGSGSNVFTMDGIDYAYAIRFSAGTYANIVFKPMICTKAAWDISQTYQPYRPSYQELYEMIKALQAAT